MTNVQLKSAVSFSVVAFMLSACADVSVRKIPTASQYQNWDDAMQRQADAIEGVRYYLPRPFVAVKQEFPFRSETHLVHGHLSSDGHSVVISNADLVTGFPFLSDAGRVPFRRMFVSRDSRFHQDNEEDFADAQSADADGGQQVGGPASAGGTQTGGDGSLKHYPVQKAVSKDAEFTHKLAGPNFPAQLIFTVLTGEGLVKADRATVRALSLIPIEEGKPNLDKRIPLPIESLDDTGKYIFKGVVPNLKAGQFMIGVEYLNSSGVICEARGKYGDPQVAIDLQVGGDSSATALGSPDNTPDFISRSVVGVSSEPNGPVVPKSRQRVALDISIADIKKTAAGANVKKVVAIGLVPLQADKSIDLSKEVSLPIGLAKENGNKWEYSYASIMDLPVGQYAVSLHLILDSGTALLVDNNAIIQVQDVEPSAAPAALCKVTPKPSWEPAPSNQPTNSNGGSGGVPSGGANTGSDGSQSTETKAETETEQKSPGGAGAMTLNISGNKDTNPLVAISDTFDVLYLPDTDEQYAVDAKANLALANVSIGLENGWMMENYGASIDNRAIANFLFFQIDKTLDVVRDMVRLDKGLIAPAVNPESTGEGGETAEAQSAALLSMIEREGMDTSQVLLKVHVVEYAVPGLYPILKPREIVAQEGYAKGNQDHAAVNFNTRKEVLVELVNISRASDQPTADTGE